MVIDSSAMVAILFREPERDSFVRAIQKAEIRRISAANYFEAALVIDGARSPVSSRFFDEFVLRAGLAIEPVTDVQARIAREAYRDFGRGSGHPAKLNFGDCFAYALAKACGEPLLYKGNDFAQTDIRSALA